MLRLIRYEHWLTIGPPMMNCPEGLRWYLVSWSNILAGTTLLITCSFKSACIWAFVTPSVCWVEITTVCTRTGTQRPCSSRYSIVTWKQLFQFNRSIKNFLLMSILKIAGKPLRELKCSIHVFFIGITNKWQKKYAWSMNKVVQHVQGVVSELD